MQRMYERSYMALRMLEMCNNKLTLSPNPCDSFHLSICLGAHRKHLGMRGAFKSKIWKVPRRTLLAWTNQICYCKFSKLVATRDITAPTWAAIARLCLASLLLTPHKEERGKHLTPRFASSFGVKVSSGPDKSAACCSIHTILFVAAVIYKLAVTPPFSSSRSSPVVFIHNSTSLGGSV